LNLLWPRYERPVSGLQRRRQEKEQASEEG
jgi:hypothetical protein